MTPAVTAIVVSFNTRDDLVACLASLQASPDVATIVVDNASADGSADAVRQSFPNVRLIENRENVGFSRANNQGLAEAHGRFVLLLNSDAQLRPGALETLVEHLEAHPRTALVGPRTVSGDGRIQVSFGPALTPLLEWRQRSLVRGVRALSPRALAQAEAQASREQHPVWVSGACLLARREALMEVAGFDPDFFLYEEDVDLCVRLASAGWSIDYTPRAEVVHQLGRSMARTASRARLEYARSHLRYYRKHNPGWQTLVLRASMALAAMAAWLRAAGSGDALAQQRQLAARIARLALGIGPPPTGSYRRL